MIRFLPTSRRKIWTTTKKNNNVRKVEDFLKQNSNLGTGGELPAAPKKETVPSYGERAALTPNPTGKKLFSIMEEKRSNLCVALDYTDSVSILYFYTLISYRLQF